MVRIKREWRQTDVAEAAGLSRPTISKHELGLIDETTVRSLRRHGSALGLRVDVVLTGRGGRLDRLTDEEHAAIVEHIAATLVARGWLVEPEATFNHFGDRGRFDLLAFDPSTGRLLIIEVKTELTDLQETQGRLNIKERVAPQVAKEHGWKVTSVSTVLAVASTPAAPSRDGAPDLVCALRPFHDRGGSVRRLRDAASDARLGPASAAGRNTWRAGRERIRTVAQLTNDRAGIVKSADALVTAPSGGYR
jgi:transcriptional regulator with XRE-family HTH domain